MSDQYVPALRQRFLEDMQIKGLQAKTLTMYLLGMRDFTRFLGHAPDSATPEELRAFQLDMKERGVGALTLNNRLTVLSFFFATTCPRPEMKRHMRYQRAAFSVAYGGGLRASEVTHLKVGDIDSDRMLIRVEQGKRSKDRQVMLWPNLLGLLRDYYNSCRNRHCQKCQGAPAKDWILARMEDLLPVEYFHVVFTLPTQIADIAYQNKAAAYDHG